MKRLILFSVILFVITACKTEHAKINENSNETSENFNKMLDDYYETGLKLNPTNATFTGDYRYNNSFPNFLSDDFYIQSVSYYNSFLNKLNTFNDNDLTKNEKMSKNVLRWECDINLERLKFKESYFPIDQMWSVNLLMGQFASGSSAQPFITVEDYKNWLQRVDEYLVWLSAAEDKMKEGISLGYVLPKSLIVKIIPQFEVTEESIESNLFYSPITMFPDSFSKDDKEYLTIAYANMVQQKIIPAYKRMHHFLSEEYVENGRGTSGISSIPNGVDYYKHQVKKYTTTYMTVDEIHQVGLNEVERILVEMEKVKEEVKFEGDLKSFFYYVRNKKELKPFTERQQVIDNFYTISNRMKPQLELLFDMVPQAAFEVKRTEEFREKSASAQYNPAPQDRSRPGIFYVPIPNVNEYNIFSDEALFLHEAIPGHHYQISLQQENPKLSKFRKNLWYSGYGEGWALYTESLGKELGLYTDPYQYFGMLGMEMHRAIRLVVDTGIHAKGWTREKAIQYSLDNEAESKESIISEIERYMANPGQALSYKIGQLKIRELHDKASDKLGDKFDIREFHNQVLSTGCVPLAVLEDEINAWIEDNK